jgi:Na+-translocating ferredoxin:NAD+ oxidoreductase RnfD subunit
MRKELNILFICGMVFALIGAAVYITHWEYAPYMYIIGAVTAAIAQIFAQPHVENVTLKRLYRQQMFGALFLVAAGILMFYSHGNEWIVCLLIGAIIELYTAFRIPQEEKKQ